jgi:hypothetical protein
MTTQTLKKQKLDRRYSIAGSLDSLPTITVSQQWIDEAHNEVFGTGDEFRPVPLSAYIDSSWSRLCDQFYRERITYIPDSQVLLLRFGGYPYEVDLDRVNSEGDLLRWVLHLSSKDWMTCERLYFFIEAVGEVKHLRIHDC